MAKTTKKKPSRAAKKKAPKAERKPAAVGRQAPPGAWTAAELLAALRRGSAGDKIAILKKAGILDANGKLSETYRNWGSKVTRTPNAEDIYGE